MVHERVNFGATLIKQGGVVVVSGGFLKGFNVGNSVEIYNIAANRWTVGNPMKTQRFAHSICESGMGKYVYAFGGQDGNLKALKTIERAYFNDENNPE